MMTYMEPVTVKCMLPCSNPLWLQIHMIQGEALVFHMYQASDLGGLNGRSTLQELQQNNVI